MARTWLSVTVELLGGRGEELWPWPGRIFAVAPSHTFLDLADAIDDAFARWDRSHLSVFTLADGRVITDDETGQEMASSSFGPVVSAVDIASAKVGRMLSLGAEFQYTFDLGDNWVHRCVVGERKIDPLDELGIVPGKPLPYWGWGSIPDQYGRRWASDDGESSMPERPRSQHPMQAHRWPSVGAVAELDITAVRVAIAAADPAGFLDALTGREIDDALQQVGSGMAMALRTRRRQAESVALSVINRLTWRGGPGDRVLAEDLLALLRREPPVARSAPVDLDELSSLLEGDFGESSTVYVDLLTGDATAATSPTRHWSGRIPRSTSTPNPTGGCSSSALDRATRGRTWRLSRSASPTTHCATGSPARSRATVRSGDSVTSSMTKVSPNSGRSSPTSVIWVEPAPRSRMPASAWSDLPLRELRV